MNSEYKIEARVKDGDTLVIFTDDRGRALHYAASMLRNKAYSIVSVMYDGQLYLGESIGRIP